MMLKEQLNARQQSFVAAYVLSGNAEQSALTANYAKTTARAQAGRLLANVGIAAAIERRQATVAVQADYTTVLWQQDLRRRIDLAEQSGSWSAVFKGMELLGRNIGALTDSGRLSADEANLFAWLGAAAERAGWGLGSPRVGTPTSPGVHELEGGGARESAGGSARAREAGEGGGTR